MTKTCTKCKRNLLVEEFAWRDKAAGERSKDCKECHRNWFKSWYERNKKSVGERHKRNREERRKWFQALKGTMCCQHCTENDPVCLEFHHEDPKEKEIDVAQAWVKGWSRERILQEIVKCIVLCSNCHKKLHHKLRIEAG